MNPWESESLIRRLASRKLISPKGCWEYDGARGTCGYGRIFFDGKNRTVSRLAWIIANKRNIEKAEVVCHTCDNRACFNPAHLFLADMKENTQDMLRKGRAPNRIGSANPNARVSEETARMIIRHRETNPLDSFKKMSTLFSIPVSTVASICSGKSWKHLKRNSNEQ